MPVKDDRKRLDVLKETEIDAAIARQRLQNASTGRPVELPGKWTVLVHMAAYGALRPFAERDLFEMSMVEDSPRLTIFVQVHWIEGEAPKIYEVKHGQGNTFQFTRSNVADPNPMSHHFTAFLTTRVPVQLPDADSPHRCMLVLWGHAIDRQFGGLGPHGMNLDEIAEGVSAARALNRKLNILGFDACDMSRVETVQELSGLATMLIGSQIGVPFSGFPYHTILARLRESPGMTEDKLSRIVLDEYYQSYEPPRVTLTMLDGRLGNTYAELDRNLKALASVLVSAFSAPLADVIRDTFLDSHNLSSDPLLDLRDFCVTLRENLNQSLAVPVGVKPAIRVAIESVIGVHDQLVLDHERRGPMVSRLNGIGFSPYTLTAGWPPAHLEIYDRVGWRRPSV